MVERSRRSMEPSTCSRYNGIMKKLITKDLPDPLKGAKFYEDENIYACLANYPIAPGHCVVVWKDAVSDIGLLSDKDFNKLMLAVEKTRTAMQNVFDTDKVYLLYMDEVDHVHWHLIPRIGSEEGITVLEHKPKKLKDTSVASKLKSSM
jgi:histidine triad (HIT) family protein